MSNENLAAVVAERDRLRIDLEAALGGQEAFARGLARMVLLYVSACETRNPGGRGELAAALVRWSLDGPEAESSGKRTE